MNELCGSICSLDVCTHGMCRCYNLGIHPKSMIVDNISLQDELKEYGIYKIGDGLYSSPFGILTVNDNDEISWNNIIRSLINKFS